MGGMDRAVELTLMQGRVRSVHELISDAVGWKGWS